MITIVPLELVSYASYLQIRYNINNSLEAI